jgi:hypothetical protein
MNQYVTNPNISKCHLLDVGLELCGSSLTVYNGMLQAKLEIDWFVAKQANTDCIKRTFTSDYWDNVS